MIIRQSVCKSDTLADSGLKLQTTFIGAAVLLLRYHCQVIYFLTLSQLLHLVENAATQHEFFFIGLRLFLYATVGEIVDFFLSSSCQWRF